MAPAIGRAGAYLKDRLSNGYNSIMGGTGDTRMSDGIEK